jgi:hypothetical protein
MFQVSQRLRRVVGDRLLALAPIRRNMPALTAIGSRRRMRRLGSAVAVLAAALAVATSAAAAGPPEPLQYTSLSPPDGEHAVAQLEGGLPWTMTATPGLNVSVALRDSRLLGADGLTLSDIPTARFDFFGLYESSTNPGYYQGVSNGGPNPNWWTAVPGTYYWQVQAGGIVPGAGFRTYVSPIFTAVITAPEEHKQPACSHGYTHARIGGSSKCLRAGQFCSWRYRRQYVRYHYACVRRGTHYRLVRR